MRPPPNTHANQPLNDATFAPRVHTYTMERSAYRFMYKPGATHRCGRECKGDTKGSSVPRVRWVHVSSTQPHLLSLKRLCTPNTEQLHTQREAHAHSHSISHSHTHSLTPPPPPVCVLCSPPVPPDSGSDGGAARCECCQQWKERGCCGAASGFRVLQFQKLSIRQRLKRKEGRLGRDSKDGKKGRGMTVT